MADEVLYHINEQEADALIKPIQAELRVLEERAGHYAHHLRMSADDRQRIESTHAVLRQAREQIEHLRRTETSA